MDEYRLRCECGNTVMVTAKQAGASAMCKCGREVRVPSMSLLRTSAGQTPVPQNIVQRISQLIADGELPQPNPCPLTALHADDILWLHVQCERVAVRHGDASWWMTFCFIFLFGWLWLLFSRNEQTTEFGHDISIVVPVLISSIARAQCKETTSQHTLKTILSSTPIYLKLLREYPAAYVSLATPADLSRLGRSGN